MVKSSNSVVLAIHHLGDNFKRGHYLSSVKVDDRWMRCNDTQISESNESESKSVECNICIYAKFFDSTTPFCPTDEWQDIKGRTVPGGLHYRFGLKGNYARNMNAGEGTKVRKQINPKQNSNFQESQTKVRPKKTNYESEQTNSNDFVKDDGWITPRKTRRLSKNPKVYNTSDIVAKDDKQEQCITCKKKFTLIFSHLSRRK